MPSGNINNVQILSWGREDISSNAQYTSTTDHYKTRIIPISYWSSGASATSWLRSPNGYYSHYSSYARRGASVDSYDVPNRYAVAGAFKLDLESVIFASAASAASIAADGGAKKISIAESDKFAQKVSDDLPNYGMYLKTGSNESFSADSLSLSGNTLTVNYTNGVQNQYIMVHAFKEDSLTNGHTSYVAAGKISTVGDPVTIDGE